MILHEIVEGDFGMEIKRRIFWWSLLVFAALAAISGTVVYYNPELMEKWYGITLLAGPPVGWLIFLVAATSGIPSQPPKEAPPAPSGEAAEEERPPEATRKEEEECVPVEVVAAQILGLLQREGRLIDFLQEDIEPYDDAQIGAAVREVHRGCRNALKEVFGIEPVINAQEGTEVEIDEDFDPSQIKLVGNVSGTPPFKGVIKHTGWKFTDIKLPKWTGKSTTNVLAPAEVELQ